MSRRTASAELGEEGDGHRDRRLGEDRKGQMMV